MLFDAVEWVPRCLLIFFRYGLLLNYYFASESFSTKKIAATQPLFLRNSVDYEPEVPAGEDGLNVAIEVQFLKTTQTLLRNGVQYILGIQP